MKRGKWSGHALGVSFLLISAAGIYFWGPRFPALPCPFKTISGIPCPGCGGTRAASSLLHGHAIEALETNPLSVLAVLFLACSFCWLSWDIARGTSTYWRLYRVPWSRPARVIAIAILLLNWAWNIYKGV